MLQIAMVAAVVARLWVVSAVDPTGGALDAITPAATFRADPAEGMRLSKEAESELDDVAEAQGVMKEIQEKAHNEVESDEGQDERYLPRYHEQREYGVDDSESTLHEPSAYRLPYVAEAQGAIKEISEKGHFKEEGEEGLVDSGDDDSSEPSAYQLPGGHRVPIGPITELQALLDESMEMLQYDHHEYPVEHTADTVGNGDALSGQLDGGTEVEVTSVFDTATDGLFPSLYGDDEHGRETVRERRSKAVEMAR